MSAVLGYGSRSRLIPIGAARPLYCQALVNLNFLLGVWSLAHTVQRPLVLGLSKHVNLHPLLEAWNSWGSYSLSDARALVNGFSVPVSGAWQGPREWSQHSGLGGPPRLGARVGRTPQVLLCLQVWRPHQHLPPVLPGIGGILERWDPIVCKNLIIHFWSRS